MGNVSEERMPAVIRFHFFTVIPDRSLAFETDPTAGRSGYRSLNETRNNGQF